MSEQSHQDGVISRRQVLASLESPHDIRRRLRRNEWAVIHPGVYVDHTGPPTWNQLAWAAVLYYEPAALAGPSALHAAGVRGFHPEPDSPIYVCVDRTRCISRRIGIVVHQRARAESLCSMSLAPARQRVEHALLDVAAQSPRLDDSVAVLADALQARHTTVARLRHALEERPKLRHRALIRDLLADLDKGVRSVLEHRYLVRVERAHGLPTAVRQKQVAVAGRSIYEDVEYEPYGLVVELDGESQHGAARDRWQDLDRDLASATRGTITIRLGFTQVLDPCRTATQLAQLLGARGWPGAVRPCGPMCSVMRSPDDSNSLQIG